MENICSITRFPTLPRDRVIESMNVVEQIKLALTSKKMENYVRSTNTNVAWCKLVIMDDISHIDIQEDLATFEKGQTKLFCGKKEFREKDTFSKISQKEIKKWCTKEDKCVLKNMINVFEKIETLFQFDNLALVFHLDSMQKLNVQQVLSTPEFKKYTSITIYGKEIESNDLKFIMDTATPKTAISIKVGKIRSDFESEHAFTFKSIEYNDAEWVKIENLYSLQDCNDVTLGNNNFKYADLNSLLRFWVDSEHDMFKSLKIATREGLQGVNNLFEDLVYFDRTGANVTFIAAKNQENREGLILCVVDAHEEMSLVTWSAKGKRPVEVGEGKFKSCEEVLEILALMEEKEELEYDLDEQENGENNRLIEAEIQELDDKLKKLGLYYDEYDLPTVN